MPGTNTERETILERLVRCNQEFPVEKWLSEAGSYYEPLATLVAQHTLAGEEEAWEFRSVADYCTDQFLRQGYVFGKSADEFLRNLAQGFGESFRHLVLYHSEGLELFVRESDGRFRLATREDEDYAFVARLAKDDESMPGPCVRSPMWAKNLYVSKKNLSAYWAIFGELPYLSDPRYAEFKRIKIEAVARESKLPMRLDGNPIPMDASEGVEIQLLRTKVIALERELAEINRGRVAVASMNIAAPGLCFQYETRGLKLVAAVQERYLGPNYDPSDPDSRPAKAQVTGWLRHEKGVESDVEAAAIDRVAMPFERGR